MIHPENFVGHYTDVIVVGYEDPDRVVFETADKSKCFSLRIVTDGTPIKECFPLNKKLKIQANKEAEA